MNDVLTRLADLNQKINGSGYATPGENSLADDLMTLCGIVRDMLPGDQKRPDPNAVISYWLETMDPREHGEWVKQKFLPVGTTREQAQQAFDQMCDAVAVRVRLVQITEQPIAVATMKC